MQGVVRSSLLFQNASVLQCYWEHDILECTVGGIEGAIVFDWNGSAFEDLSAN